MPSGRETVMPTNEMTHVTNKPPQRCFNFGEAENAAVEQDPGDDRKDRKKNKIAFRRLI